MPNQPVSPSRPWLYSAAVMSVIAGAIHLVVTPEHFAEWIGYGLFFLVATIAQLGYAVLLLAQNPTRPVLLAGIRGNSLISGLYLISRSLGIPFLGPEAGEVEPVGVHDTLSKIVELGLIACLVVLLRTQPDSAQGGRPDGGAVLRLL